MNQVKKFVYLVDGIPVLGHNPRDAREVLLRHWNVEELAGEALNYALAIRSRECPVEFVGMVGGPIAPRDFQIQHGTVSFPNETSALSIVS